MPSTMYVISRVLVKPYVPTVFSRNLMSCVMLILFVMVTTHLILMEPLYHKSKTKSVSQGISINARSFSEKSHKPPSTCQNFVVFDAEGYYGNLSFLEKQTKGWCVLVIGLTDSLQLSTCGNCLSLKDEWIKHNVVNFVEKKHGGKSTLTYSQFSKMAAYMYVLLHGAKWIYVTNRPTPIPYPVFMEHIEQQVQTGPVYGGPDDIFEPCGHFVDFLTWRGRASRQVQGRYNIKVVSPQSIYQIVNSCFKPGMDKDTQKKSFDSQAPVLYVMPGTYAAIDFLNVLISRNNAWSLVASLIPSSDTGNNGNISINNNIRNRSNSNNRKSSSKDTTLGVELNMMIQRILWETDTRIGFIPGSPGEMACPSCDMFSQMSSTKKEHLHALLNWRCDSFQGVETCLSQLALDGNIVNGNHKTLIRSWVALLDEHKIPSVERVPISEEKIKEKEIGISMYFSPARLLRKVSENDTTPLNLNPFQTLCSNQNTPYRSVIPDKYPITKILLIIVFNFPFLVSHIPLLDYVYGRHFKHVLYCSESITDFEQRYQRVHPDNPVSYIEIKHYMGYWGQNCMSAAIKLGMDVTGYLQISDDVIMNIWNFDKLPYRQPWFQSNLRVAHIDHAIVPDVWINHYWWPWSQFSGKKSAMAAHRDLTSRLADPIDGDKISAFMENLYNITNCDRCFLYEASDIFYVPKELGVNFTFFSDIFSYNQVFLEITIPTVLAGITSDREMYRLRGNYLWFHDRDRYPYVYTEYDHFYHAWKLSRFADKNEMRFFCRQFLSRVDKHLMKQHNT